MEVLSFEKEIDLGCNPVMTIGMFDGVHTGHQKLLDILKNKAKEYNTKPVVITFNKHPRLVLQPEDAKENLRLLQTNQERFEKLNRFGIETIIGIDFTKGFSKLSAIEFIDLLIKKYSPKFLLLGYDNHFGKKSDEFQDIVALGKTHGLEIERVSDCVFYNNIEVSSTQIRKALEKGDVIAAKFMLGESYMLSGKVVHGNKIGRTIGFPTANVNVDEYKLLPKSGVYAVKVDLEGNSIKGIMSIGKRPTIAGDLSVCVEVHLFDFSGNIYDKKINVSIIDFIREEQKFDSIENLKNQIIKDCNVAKDILNKNE